MPSAIARSAAASSAADPCCPRPVAATTIPSAPAACERVDQRPVHRDGRGDEVDPLGGARRRPRDVAVRAHASEPDPPVRHPPERPDVEAPERVERARRASSSRRPPARSCRRGRRPRRGPRRRPRRRGDPDRVAQVRRPVEAGLGGGPHRAGHDDRLRAVEEEVPEERRLLDRVGALDDDRAVDRRDRPSASARTAAISNSAGNVEVAGRRQAAVDRDRRRRSRRARAVASRSAPSRTGTLPPAAGVVTHADRAAGEDDRDPWHRAVSRPAGDRDRRRDRGPGPARRVGRRPGVGVGRRLGTSAASTTSRRDRRRPSARARSGSPRRRRPDRSSATTCVARDLGAERLDERVAVRAHGRPGVAFDRPQRPAQVDRERPRRSRRSPPR